MIRSRATASLRRDNGGVLWSRTLRLTMDRSYASVTAINMFAASAEATNRWPLSRSNGGASPRPLRRINGNAAGASALEVHSHRISDNHRTSSRRRWCTCSSLPGTFPAYACQPLLRRCASAGGGSTALGAASSNVFLGCGSDGCGRVGVGVGNGVGAGGVMNMTTAAVPAKKKQSMKSNPESGESANGITFETGKVISTCVVLVTVSVLLYPRCCLTGLAQAAR